jgi:hypothetical protein
VFDAPVEVCQLTPKKANDNPELLKRVIERYCKSVGQLIPEGHPDWCESAFHLERRVAVRSGYPPCRTNLAGMIVLGLKTRSTFGRYLHTSFANAYWRTQAVPFLQFETCRRYV